MTGGYSRGQVKYTIFESLYPLGYNFTARLSGQILEGGLQINILREDDWSSQLWGNSKYFTFLWNLLCPLCDSELKSGNIQTCHQRRI